MTSFSRGLLAHSTIKSLCSLEENAWCIQRTAKSGTANGSSQLVGVTLLEKLVVSRVRPSFRLGAPLPPACSTAISSPGSIESERLYVRQEALSRHVYALMHSAVQTSLHSDSASRPVLAVKTPRTRRMAPLGLRSLPSARTTGATYQRRSLTGKSPPAVTCANMTPIPAVCKRV